MSSERSVWQRHISGFSFCDFGFAYPRDDLRRSTLALKPSTRPTSAFLVQMHRISRPPPMERPCEFQEQQLLKDYILALIGFFSPIPRRRSCQIASLVVPQAISVETQQQGFHGPSGFDSRRQGQPSLFGFEAPRRYVGPFYLSQLRAASQNPTCGWEMAHAWIVLHLNYSLAWREPGSKTEPERRHENIWEVQLPHIDRRDHSVRRHHDNALHEARIYFFLSTHEFIRALVIYLPRYNAEARPRSFRTFDVYWNSEYRTPRCGKFAHSGEDW
ncbi:hypothetical protein C8F04DRAFT_1237926 [Mycena alexandri]|uniref:Uncharacterized protein n=1 Tax=Mycena alexandri TaxID=1745969 RepID=A0AAD6SLG7_9AGAR|nr:hypothetical protein C8F04DRAFT_1237926 [Mycena alexandri]